MKSNQRHLYFLIASLLLVGFSIFFYRFLVLDVPLTETEQVDSWTIEANLKFDAESNMPIKADFTIPHMPPSFVILDEYFVAQNYGITTNLNDYNRYAIWTQRRGHGRQSLYYRAIVRETENKEMPMAKPPVLKINRLPENLQTAVNTIINQARQSSADIQTFTQSTLKELNKKDGNARLLMGSHLDETHLVDAAIMVLNQARIQAMPVQGIYLSQSKNSQSTLFLAVFNGQKWIYFNPETAATGLPKHVLVWQYGNDPLYHLSGGKRPQFIINSSSTPLNALSVAKAHALQTNSQLLRFSLLQLPVPIQDTYKILLTIPLGAFVILILRNYIGLKTFGTFMPVLIALAFRETHVVWGIALFILIVSLGLLARFYLDQLRLLLVPRLASILTIVILLMIFISIICQNLQLSSGLSVALFPMVILTMTIERMCITWDERGASEAIQCGLGSLIAAVITFEVMNHPSLQYLLFAFPELLLVLLALILIFGQYRGYRLMELVRFKALSE